MGVHPLRSARRTNTSSFGVGRRESHDSAAFYSRFRPPVIDDSGDYTIAPDLGAGCFHGDIRDRDDVPDGSVALVVTSPPYFAGKEYEEALGHGLIPASYADFLRMLSDVFAVCAQKLEPGGRMAVNVANLGRKPYRSLSADVISILQDDLGLLLRGEVIWKKGDGASGNCAWGSFRSPGNPVLRDITERVVIASKGRFGRVRTPAERAALGHPSEITLTADEFMSATLDVWEMEPESATRVNHPAPFPVQLPERLIHLYTYKDDLVLDPFLGSGSTLVAAFRTGRRGAGYDTDEGYVALARARVAEARANPIASASPHALAVDEGKAAKVIARRVVERAGFRVTADGSKLKGTGVVMDLIALDRQNRPWYFDVSGSFTTTRGGLSRTDAVWRCLGRAHVVRNKVNSATPVDKRIPVVLLTSDLPRRSSDGDVALRAAGPVAIFDAVEMLSDSGQERLQAYASGGHRTPLPGFWSASELAELAGCP